MKSITYIGAHDEVIIPSLGIRCANGATVEVEDEAAASLLEQAANWELAKASPSKPAKESKPNDE